MQKLNKSQMRIENQGVKSKTNEERSQKQKEKHEHTNKMPPEIDGASIKKSKLHRGCVFDVFWGQPGIKNASHFDTILYKSQRNGPKGARVEPKVRKGASQNRCRNSMVEKGRPMCPRAPKMTAKVMPAALVLHSFSEKVIFWKSSFFLRKNKHLPGSGAPEMM